jgi:hypothetical protein
MKNSEQPNAKIEITKDGPYLVTGGFCDGSHAA